MIEKFMILMINELGPIGLLVIGLYWVLGRHLAKISHHIEIINAETGKINETIRACADRICDHLELKK